MKTKIELEQKKVTEELIKVLNDIAWKMAPWKVKEKRWMIAILKRMFDLTNK